ncbi:RNA polymerase sigma-70 factor (sigma-E family) [Streptomyces sp. SLBN-118]|uniref:SigE family RNA polymerase sigma factor n=1 Tax=Streptomyces sp. SLBN-118 TaxID=2768454 RepID=UPI00114E0EDF|nr:SigE family RNA polymerase sigma factor [Streptomyces sp. SLBN-118]TQK50728.1 RNA polymerase sigma-70 factor (sigma-E family) [Streptomyces sp. SLBN-118]
MRTATTPTVPAGVGGPPSAAYRPGLFFVGVSGSVLSRAWHRLLHGSSDRHNSFGGEPPQARSITTSTTPAALGKPRIDELYHHRRLGLVRLALLLVDDLPTAEDVVQDAFAALYHRHGDQLARLDDPEAYLRTSVLNTARSVLRRRRTARAHTPERVGHAPPAEEAVLLREEHREVLHALRRLTQRQREVLILRYWSNLTEAEIADALGLSRGTVKSTASRALDALSRQFEAEQ